VEKRLTIRRVSPAKRVRAVFLVMRQNSYYVCKNINKKTWHYGSSISRAPPYKQQTTTKIYRVKSQTKVDGDGDGKNGRCL
jgi:hypothetical protein